MGGVGWPPIPFSLGCPIFWPLCPSSCFNHGRDASCPIFLLLPRTGCT